MSIGRTHYPETARGAFLWALAWARIRLHGLLFATSIVLAGAAGLSQERLAWGFAFQPPFDVGGAARFDTPMDLRSAGVMHSPHIAVAGGAARVLWFQGSGEAVPDVEIWAADLADGGRFGDSFEMFDAGAIGRVMAPGQPVVILGNTIQAEPGFLDGYIATVVSAGGWAAASLAKLRIRDGVAVSARKLPLSPLLNRSYLVRGGVVRFGDGDLGVPAYHELVAGFGLIVRIGLDGRVRSTARIGHGRLAIQPEVVVTGARTAVAFLRPFDRSHRLFRSETVDGGQSWTRPAPVAGIGNPNAPVAVLLMSDGRLLMAANRHTETDRSLSLLVSGDQGRSWREVVELEDFGSEPRSAVRYPDLARLGNGDILVTYSIYSKHGIRAHLFNEAWVNTRG